MYRLRGDCERKIDELRHNQGKAYTEAENRQAVITYLRFKHDNARGNAERKSTVQLIRDVSRVLCRGLRLLKQVIYHYEDVGEVYVSTGGSRGLVLCLDGSLTCIIRSWEQEMDLYSSAFLRQRVSLDER